MAKSYQSVFEVGENEAFEMVRSTRAIHLPIRWLAIAVGSAVSTAIVRSRVGFTWRTVPARRFGQDSRWPTPLVLRTEIHELTQSLLHLAVLL